MRGRSASAFAVVLMTWGAINPVDQDQVPESTRLRIAGHPV